VAETGSTNADLLARAAEGQAEGAVLVTDHQTAGRGRQSRNWHDEPGNAMLMSVLLRPGPELAALVPLVAGLAVTDGVDELVASHDPASVAGPEPRRLALKWPNDVIVPELGERKLCGILAEASTATGPAAPAGPGPALVVVVGMGLNIRWSSPPPFEIAERAATLEEVAGREIDRWDVVRAVLRGLDGWLARATADPTDVLDHYRRRCVTLGRRVRMQTAAGVIEGFASGITGSGGLVLDTGDGSVEVTAGDAHHL
jgi:BirA family biotin operon repressor/biotin-[acetyl-CoA-carboxylase] ligase